MVGDRPREDVAGATAAGLAALLYDPHGRAPGPGSVRDLRQVPRRLPSPVTAPHAGLLRTTPHDAGRRHPRHDHERGDARRVHRGGVGEPAVPDERNARVIPQPGQSRPVSALTRQSGTGDLHPRRQQHCREQDRGRGEQQQPARRGHGRALPVQRHQAQARPPRSAAAALSATSHQSKTRPGVTSCTSSSSRPTAAAARPPPNAAPMPPPEAHAARMASSPYSGRWTRPIGEEASSRQAAQRAEPEGGEREVRPGEGRAGAQQAADEQRAGQGEHGADGARSPPPARSAVRPLHEPRGVGQGQEDPRRVQREHEPARAVACTDDTRGRWR